MPTASNTGAWSHLEEELSAGTSFLTSGSKPDRSGLSPQDTGSSLPLPAPDVESPSDQDLLARPESSTATSTDGSSRGTTSGPQSPSTSSAVQEPAVTTQDKDYSEEEPSSGSFLITE